MQLTYKYAVLIIKAPLVYLFTYLLMENYLPAYAEITPVDWYSEEFIYKSVVNFLKEKGYKVHKDNSKKGFEKTGRSITASRFFKKEVIEVKGFPHYYHPAARDAVPAKSTSALFNSFVNFSMTDNAEVAMAVPNVSRYQAIIEKLNDYFSVNDLYFRIYLVNEDGSVEVSNLNDKFAKSTL